MAFTWESSFRVGAQTNILYNELEDYTFNITATCPRGQRVKTGNNIIIQHSDLLRENTIMSHEIKILPVEMSEKIAYTDIM